MKKLFFLFLFSVSASFVNGQIAEEDGINASFNLAIKFERAGEYGQAEQILKTLYLAKPHDFRIFDALNRIYIRQKSYEASLKIIREQLSNSPNNINFYGMLGSTYYTMGNDKKAFEAWEEGLEKNHKSVTAYRIIANYAIENRVFGKAAEILKRGQEISGSNNMFTTDLAQIYSVTMNYTSATEEYCKLILDNPKQLDFVQRRMSTYLEGRGALDSAIIVVEKFSDENPESPSFMELLSYLYSQKNDFENAFNAIKEAEQYAENDGSRIYNFGLTAMHSGEYKVAEDAFRMVLDNYDDPKILNSSEMNLAKTREEIINSKLADESNNWKPLTLPDTAGSYKYLPVLEEYAGLATKFQKGVYFQEASFRRGLIFKNKMKDYKSAKKEFSRIVEHMLKGEYTARSLLELGKISIIRGDLKSAGNYFKKLTDNRLFTGEISAEGNYYLGKIKFWQGNFTDAAKVISKLTDNLSDEIANDALELKMLVNIMNKDSVNLIKFAGADFKTAQLMYNEAASEFGDLALNENLIFLNELSQLRMSEIFIALGNYAEASVELEKIVERENLSVFNDKSLYLLGNVYEYALNDSAKALFYYEKVLAKYPSSIYFDRARKKVNDLTQEKRDI